MKSYEVKFDQNRRQLVYADGYVKSDPLDEVTFYEGDKPVVFMRGVTYLSESGERDDKIEYLKSKLSGVMHELEMAQKNLFECRCFTALFVFCGFVFGSSVTSLLIAFFA